MAEGSESFAFFGCSVKTAGDVNGDGYDDVIVGARGANGGGSDRGEAYVYLGGPGGLAASPVWVQAGYDDTDQFGHAVSTAGDVDGDGYADVLIGAPFREVIRQDAGAAYLFRGGPTGPSSSWSWSISGFLANANLGFSVGPAGDINGDGFADLVIGGPGYNGTGRAWVARGNRFATGLIVQTLDGEDSGDRFGASVSGGGDVTGDGLADVLVGADNADNTAGRSYLFVGQAAGPVALDGMNVMGTEMFASLGGIGGAGDVNGDGFADVLVGCHDCDDGLEDQGVAWLFTGTPDGPSISPDWVRHGGQQDAAFGVNPWPAGDVNGDGYDDVAINSFYYDSTFVDGGKLEVFHGSPSGLSNSPDWVEVGSTEAEYFGRAITAGDVNGDGFADLLVSSPGYDNGQTDEGRIWLYHGSSGGLESSPAWWVELDQEGIFLQRALGAGDVNGDGYSDVLVASENYNTEFARAGLVRLYLGSQGGLAMTPAWEMTGERDVAFFGSSTSAAGDVNGDGFADVLIGADGFSNTQTFEGRAYLFLGKETGLSTTPAWIGEADQAYADYGNSVAGADLNGDGFSDVIVGARFYDTDVTAGGRLFIYYGSPTGPSDEPDVTHDGGEPSDYFTHVIASPGDVDGDGFDDLALTAPGVDFAEGDEGTAYFIPGSPQGLKVLAVQRDSNSQPVSYLGVSDDPESFNIEGRGWNSAGRRRIRMEYQVAPVGESIRDAPAQLGNWVMPPAPSGGEHGEYYFEQPATGLRQNTVYQWRFRVRSGSPWFPWGRWHSTGPRVPSQGQIRTGGGPIAGTDPVIVPGPILIGAAPNPMRARSSIAFSLEERGRARLAVFDAQGRLVRMLLDEQLEAGGHRSVWRGENENGRLVAAGVYFLQLDANGVRRLGKVVVRE